METHATAVLRIHLWPLSMETCTDTATCFIVAYGWINEWILFYHDQ